MKILCIGYLITLTFLLVTKEPLRLVDTQTDLCAGLRSVAPVGHFLAFLLLALLALAARWPGPRWVVVLCLAAYAVGTEMLQGFVPTRTPDAVDCVQDLAGILIGGAIYWFAVYPRSDIEPVDIRDQTGDPTGPTDDWEAFLKIRAGRATSDRTRRN